MFKKTINIMALLALVVVTASAGLANAADTDVQKKMKAGDSLWPERADVAKAVLGADYYRDVLKADPRNYEAAWKLARNLCWVAEHSKGDRRLNAASEAVDAAEKAVEIAPDRPAGHFYLGLAWGYYGHANGIFKTLFLIRPIEEEFGKVIEIDPGYEGGAAYTALGRGYFFWPGRLDKAIEYFKTALQYGPKVYGTKLFLAEAYMKAGQGKQARRLLEEILAGPAQPGQEPEYVEWRGEAEYLMRKLDEMEKNN